MRSTPVGPELRVQDEGVGYRVAPHRLAGVMHTGACTVRRNVERFRGGLVLKAHRWLYHSTLGSRVIKKKKMTAEIPTRPECRPQGTHQTLLPHP